MNSLSFFEVQPLLDNHPQLTEKSLVDFTNSLEVIDDHIRFREGQSGAFCARIWGHLTGEENLRQRRIDQNINTSLNIVSQWLTYVQVAQIKSDLAITKVTNKLLETRKGVMLIKQKQNALDYQVQNILNKIEEMDVQYHQLNHRIEQVDAGRLAEQQMSAVFDKWKARHFHIYSPLVRLFLIFDELYWGDLGNYCRNYRYLNGEIDRLIQQVKDKALVQLREDLIEINVSSELAYPWQEELAENIKTLELPRQQLIAYLTDESDDYSRSNTPMLWSLHKLASFPSVLIAQKLKENKYLPILLNAQNTVNRFSIDFETRYAKHAS